MVDLSLGLPVRSRFPQNCGDGSLILPEPAGESTERALLRFVQPSFQRIHASIPDHVREAVRQASRLGNGGQGGLLNFDRAALALDAAFWGHGIAIAPTYMVEGDVNRKRLVEVWVSPERPTEHLFVSWSHEYVRQPDVLRVVDWIAAEFTQERTLENR